VLPAEAIALVDEEHAAPHAPHVDGRREAGSAAADDDAIQLSSGEFGLGRVSGLGRVFGRFHPAIMH